MCAGAGAGLQQSCGQPKPARQVRQAANYNHDGPAELLVGQRIEVFEAAGMQVKRAWRERQERSEQGHVHGGEQERGNPSADPLSLPAGSMYA